WQECGTLGVILRTERDSIDGYLPTVQMASLPIRDYFALCLLTPCECAMSRKAVSRLRRKEREGGSLGQELPSRAIRQRGQQHAAKAKMRPKRCSHRFCKTRAIW